MRDGRVGSKSPVADYAAVELLESARLAFPSQYGARIYLRGAPGPFGLGSSGDEEVGVGESIASDPDVQLLTAHIQFIVGIYKVKHTRTHLPLGRPVNRALDSARVRKYYCGIAGDGHSTSPC